MKILGVGNMMLKEGIFVFFLLFLFFVESNCQKSPKDIAKSKCSKRIKNEDQLEKCKKCVDDFSLPVSPTKYEIRNLIRECLPRKDAKEWVKGKCSENTEGQFDVEACFQCVDDFVLPQNVTKDDVQAMRKACLPTPSLKFKAKRKCVKKLRNKGDIEACQNCIESFKLSDKPSCEEVNEMKRQCITERQGRDLWTEPLLDEDEDL